MKVGGLTKKANQLKEKVSELKESAYEAVDQSLTQFNEAVPVLQSLGLNVKDVQVGMGVIPEVQAKLIGSIDAVDADKLSGLIEENQEKAALVTILKGLQAASHIKGRLAQLTFSGIEVNVKLGLPPKISVSFV